MKINIEIAVLIHSIGNMSSEKNGITYKFLPYLIFLPKFQLISLLTYFFL
jgi:hypothetical protein